jgi:UDP-N-acetylmuramyl pentapeptide phosphotransferase/UDP-N-acetylglucosamine-1-phosphate transferase
MLVSTFGPLVDAALPPPFGGPIPRAVLAWGLSVLWLTTVVNFFNFMDGIDGLAAGQAVASCIGIVAAAWSGDATVLALSVGAACLGFLLHNAPRARIFMGDSGSGFLGFVLAAAPFAAPTPERGAALLAVAIGLSLFLLDPIRTLIKRTIERRNIFRAHREHLYQELVAPDEPAGRVAAAYSLTAVLLALCGAAGYRWPTMFWVGGFTGAVAFLIVWQRARQASKTRSLRRAPHSRERLGPSG